MLTVLVNALDVLPPDAIGRHWRFKLRRATIKGFEVMHALRKGQASAFNITRDIRGEARIVERAFGLGASVLAETVQFHSEQIELEAA